MELSKKRQAYLPKKYQQSSYSLLQKFHRSLPEGEPPKLLLILLKTNLIY